MKAFVLAAAAVVFAVLPAGRFCGTETVSSTVAYTDGSGDAYEVKLAAVKAFEDSDAYRKFELVYEKEGKEIRFPLTDSPAYGARIGAFDFYGNGTQQIFFAASSGGSGGYGYYIIVDISSDMPFKVFDSENYSPPNYEAERGEDGFVYLTLSGKRVAGFAASGRGEGGFINEPFAGGISFAEPAYMFTENRYRLNLWRNVSDTAAYDVVGRIISVLDFRGGAFCPGTDVFENCAEKSGEESSSPP